MARLWRRLRLAWAPHNGRRCAGSRPLPGDSDGRDEAGPAEAEAPGRRPFPVDPTDMDIARARHQLDVAWGRLQAGYDEGYWPGVIELMTEVIDAGSVLDAALAVRERRERP